MTTIGHLLIWTPISILIGLEYWNYRKLYSHKTILDTKLAELKGECAKAIKVCEDKTLPLFVAIRNYGGEKYTEAISNKQLIIGMPQLLVRMIKGTPDEIKERVNGDSKYITWYFGEYKNRLNNTKYTFKVDFENDYVVGWANL